MKKKRHNKIYEFSFLTLMVGMASIIIAGPEIKILSDYLVHIMFGFFFLGLTFLVFNQPRLLLTSFGICGILCVLLKNESNTELIFPNPNNESKIAIAHFNLANINSIAEFKSTLDKLNVDILSLQEYTPDWSLILDSIVPLDYKHIAKLLRIDPYGKIIYSKYPILDVDTINHKDFAELKITCSDYKDKFLLYSSYITPVLDKLSKNRAQQQLKSLSNDIQSSKDTPLFAFGEYNSVYWSEEIKSFREQTRLNNSRKEIIPASLKPPYEHIFFSNELECLSEGAITNSSGEKIGYRGTYQFKSSSSKNTFSYLSN